MLISDELILARYVVFMSFLAFISGGWGLGHPLAEVRC